MGWSNRWCERWMWIIFAGFDVGTIFRLWIRRLRWRRFHSDHLEIWNWTCALFCWDYGKFIQIIWNLSFCTCRDYLELALVVDDHFRNLDLQNLIEEQFWLWLFWMINRDCVSVLYGETSMAKRVADLNKRPSDQTPMSNYILPEGLP